MKPQTQNGNDSGGIFEEITEAPTDLSVASGQSRRRNDFSESSSNRAHP